MLAWNDYIQAVIESQPSLMAEQLKKRGMRFKAFVLRVRLSVAQLTSTRILGSVLGSWGNTVRDAGRNTER